MGQAFERNGEGYEKKTGGFVDLSLDSDLVAGVHFNGGCRGRGGVDQ